jgi:hypothetical protein
MHTRRIGAAAALAAALLMGCGGGGGGSKSKLVGGGSTGGGTTAAAPSSLAATAISASAIDLSWVDNASDEDGFRVERRNSRLSPWSVIGQAAADAVAFSDTGLASGVTYTYRVTAFKGSNDLGTSNEASATTQIVAPTCTEWSEVNGTGDEDRARGTTFDPGSGTIYVVGTTREAIGAQHFGGQDGYLRAYDATGAVQWSQQIGTTSEDWTIAVAVDGSGNIYVAGFTEGQVAGNSFGARDAFVHKYGPNGGRPLWTGHYGTGRDDHVAAVAVDPNGKVVIGGTSRNVSAGNEQDPWMAQFDTTAGSAPQWTWVSGNGFFNENLSDMAIDPVSGDVYAIGRTQVVMPNVIGTPPNGSNTWAVGDIYVAKVDAAGVEQWIVQVGSGCGMGATSAFDGTGGDIPGGVAVSITGEIYVTGFAQGEAAGPGSYLGPDANTHRPASQLCNAQDWNVWGDAVLFKLDDAGSVQWTRQFGSSGSDWARDVVVAGGKVYVAGVTQADVSTNGTGNAGGVDRFVAAYSSTGSFEWIRQSGTADDDWAYAMSTDGADGIHVVGGFGPTNTFASWAPIVERVCD